MVQAAPPHHALPLPFPPTPQGRGTLKAELQRKESDLGRAQATHEAQAALIDELKAAGEKAAQVRGCALGGV